MELKTNTHVDLGEEKCGAEQNIFRHIEEIKYQPRLNI